MRAYGLQSHIWSNNTKSILLLIGFPVLLLLLFYGLVLGGMALGGQVDLGRAMQDAAAYTARNWYWAVLAAGIWFAIAWVSYGKIIEATTGARGLSRTEAPDLYNMLENLCIERGIPMPRLAIIETPALNAFASGLTDTSYTVTLTRGIINTLDERELRAVMAHELTHITNRDVRLLIISVIFVGIFSFFGEILFRNMFRVGRRTGGYTRSRNGDSRGGGAIILVAVGIIVMSYLLAMVIRFALSQRREYLADAGAVDLTRDPDAMISALKKISGRSDLDAPADVQQMCIDNDNAFAGIFMTHPSIDKRVQALIDYAGGEG